MSGNLVFACFKGFYRNWYRTISGDIFELCGFGIQFYDGGVSGTDIVFSAKPIWFYNVNYAPVNAGSLESIDFGIREFYQTQTEHLFVV